MKRLTRLLLINWHYFTKQIINFGTTNFLTGKNSVGKSTVIDALQAVIMGATEMKDFNRAANKKSDRTLRGYLIGAMGEDIENGEKSLRGKNDFTSYVVMEIYDENKGKYFCLGAVFDCYSNGDLDKKYFYMPDGLPFDCFIRDKTAMDTKQLAGYLKEKYPNRHEITGTIKTYRQIVLSKLNVHEDKMFTMLKKSISFEPITNIEKFITENVCDISEDDKIDVESMKANIEDYKRQEEIAREFENKLIELQRIKEIYGEILNLHDTEKHQNFFIDYARYEITLQNLQNIQQQVLQYDTDIADLQQEYGKISELITEMEMQKQLLENELNDFRTEKGIDRLEENKKYYKNLIENINGRISRFVLNIRQKCAEWIRIVSNISADDYSEICTDILGRLKNLENIRDNNISDEYSVEFFRDTDKKFTELKNNISPFISEITVKKGELEKRKTEVSDTIENLKKGIKQYPPKAQKLKETIASELRKMHGDEVKVDFFADMINITDEEWHDAVEGYLNTQRMYLIIEPQYFHDAYMIFKKIRHSAGDEYRIIDCRKVYDNRRNTAENSLAEVVASENIYAKAYADYLLGNVIRCYDDSKIRDFKKSVTRDCMIYSGFSVGSLNQSAYTAPYIGRNSIARQIENKERELTEIQQSLSEISALLDNLLPVINKTWFLTNRIETVSEIFASADSLADYRAELDEIIAKLDSIDNMYIYNIGEKISNISAEIDKYIKKSKEVNSKIIKYEYQKQNLTDKDIPQSEREVSEAHDTLNVQYDSDYISAEKILYDTESQGNPQDIISRYSVALKKTETVLKSKISEAVNLRSDYNRNYNIAFNIEINDDYEKEYEKIKEHELPQYKEKIAKAYENAMLEFRHEFLYKLQENINKAQNAVHELNTALKKFEFGNDRYIFHYKPNQAYMEYYNMIMDENLIEKGYTLLTDEFEEKYKSTIESLFANLEKNSEFFSDYRTYLNFDITIKDSLGQNVYLSKEINKKSGGEFQTPFYLAVLASFAHLYKVSEYNERGNTFRLVIFDEAFNKMDSDRIIESVNLLKNFGLQAIICTPPDKISDISPIADKTLLVVKETNAKGYKSQVIECNKKLIEEINEL